MSIDGDESLLGQLRSLVDERGLLVSEADVGRYLCDWRGLYRGQAICVVRPRNTSEVAAVVRVLAAAGISIVPQGGNTSLVGGAIPDTSGRQVLLSLERLNRVRQVDVAGMTMIAEAGVVLKTAQLVAEAAGCFFPLSLAAEGSATIGGVLATNAGGNTTIRYGNAREMMLGLEVVLADGRIWNGLRSLRKDNTGYALRHLFVGSEGTLGVITAATLRLFPRPIHEETALCSVANPDRAVALHQRFRGRDEASLQAFEYISGQAMDMVLSGIEAPRLPLDTRAEHYVLVDLGSSRPHGELRSLMEGVLEEALEAGEIIDAAVADAGAQRQAIWRLREEQSDAQKRAGASIKNDVAVPLSAIADLLRLAPEAVQRICPGIRPAPFGHLGDGNIHLNFVQPADMPAETFLGHAEEIMAAVNAIVRKLGGSFSAEHGIGQLKTEILASWHSDVELESMRKIKNALDPSGLMNPGKIFRVQ